jgi:hypothetical protein
MADEDRPRNSIEALIDRPLFQDGVGGRGIGPTLGVQAPHPQPAPRETKVWPSDADEPDHFAETSERGPHEHHLGSEIAAAGGDLSPDILRPPGPPGENELPRRARRRAWLSGAAPVPPPDGRKSGGGL